MYHMAHSLLIINTVTFFTIDTEEEEEEEENLLRAGPWLAQISFLHLLIHSSSFIICLASGTADPRDTKDMGMTRLC